MNERVKGSSAMEPSRARRIGMVVGGVLLAVGVCSVFLPVIPIVLGMLLIVAVGLHAGSTDLQPYIEHLLRMPVAKASRRRARLGLTATLGALLIASGAVGATTRGRLRVEWEQEAKHQEAAEVHVRDLLQRARASLEEGNVAAAEFALLEAEGIEGVDNSDAEGVDELLERVRRSGDAETIRGILQELSPQELQSLRAGKLVPEALRFPERALTFRAVDVAMGQLNAGR